MAQSIKGLAAIMRSIAEHELGGLDAGHEARIPVYRGAPMPEANPKASRAVADGKAPLDYLEPVCDAGEARVLKGGADKYGRRNFRDPSTEMLWSTYLGSMRRHLNALHAGEDVDPDSGEHHLSHLRANTAVLQAAMDAGTLRDDRLETTVTSRSDAVHKDGNQDAKADEFPVAPRPADGGSGGAALGHVIHYTAADIGAVEPFVVDARCTFGCTRVNEACAIDGTVEVARPVEPFVVDVKCCAGSSCTVDEDCTYADSSWCRSMRVA